MTWQQIKDKIYYTDGSLRDIYVLQTTRYDWQKWADFVNENYKVLFHIYEDSIYENIIDLTKILSYWDGVSENRSMATVFIGSFQVNVFFFTPDKIENDICTKEFESFENHEQLIRYMCNISEILNKEVILTPENNSEIKLISVIKDKILFA